MPTSAARRRRLGRRGRGAVHRGRCGLGSTDRARVAPVPPVELQTRPAPEQHLFLPRRDHDVRVVARRHAGSPSWRRISRPDVASGFARSRPSTRSRSPGTEEPCPCSGRRTASLSGCSPTGTLKRQELSSGIAVPLCQVNSRVGHQGTWSTNGQILFASTEGEAIHAVPSAGGSRI